MYTRGKLVPGKRARAVNRRSPNEPANFDCWALQVYIARPSQRQAAQPCHRCYHTPETRCWENFQESWRRVSRVSRAHPPGGNPVHARPGVEQLDLQISQTSILSYAASFFRQNRDCGRSMMRERASGRRWHSLSSAHIFGRCKSHKNFIEKIPNIT